MTIERTRPENQTAISNRFLPLYRREGQAVGGGRPVSIFELRIFTSMGRFLRGSLNIPADTGVKEYESLKFRMTEVS
jgi:hypothetical protein